MKIAVFYIFVFLTLVSCDNKSAFSQKPETPIPPETYRKLIDLSHDFSDETIYWVTAEEFKLDTVFNGQTPKGFIIQPIISVQRNMAGRI